MFSLKKKAAVVAAGIALVGGGAVLAAAPAGAVTVPTSFVSLSYGPNHVAGHQLALDVLGQVKADGTPIVAWESDEYQGVPGAVDPAEQFVQVPIYYSIDITAPTTAPSTTPVPSTSTYSAYLLEWAPGGDPSGYCVDDQSTAEHTHAVIEPCATHPNDFFKVPGVSDYYVSGSVYQDFLYDTDYGVTNTNQLAHYGYGELEPVIGGAKTVPAPALGAFGSNYTGSTALNDSAYVNGGHVISWHANSETNEEFKFRPIP